jgi:hypothetical protein
MKNKDCADAQTFAEKKETRWQRATGSKIYIKKGVYYIIPPKH